MFTHKIPSVPNFSVEQLVALISDPKKAAEYWEQYKTLREELEAVRASVTAQAEALSNDMNSFQAKNDVLEEAKRKFERHVDEYEAEIERYKVAKYEWLKQKAEAESEAARVAAQFVAERSAFDNASREFDFRTRLWEQESEAALKKLEEREQALAERERAVSDREIKVQELVQRAQGI